MVSWEYKSPPTSWEVVLTWGERSWPGQHPEDCSARVKLTLPQSWPEMRVVCKRV